MNIDMEKITTIVAEKIGITIEQAGKAVVAFVEQLKEKAPEFEVTLKKVLPDFEAALKEPLAGLKR